LISFLLKESFLALPAKAISLMVSAMGDSSMLVFCF
jgi:hypothetical protein